MNKATRIGFLLAAVALGLLVTSAPLFAHHAFAAEFDVNKPVTLTGSVIKLEWTNPHAHFYISVKDDHGGTTEWEFEMGSPNALVRHGWTRNSLKPGDIVTVAGYLAKDGSKLANARSVTLSDGRKVFAGSSVDGEQGQIKTSVARQTTPFLRDNRNVSVIYSRRRIRIETMPTEAAVSPAVARLNQVRNEIAKIIVGQQSVVDGVLICLLGAGHVLLEGVPGLGKTTLLRTLARALSLRYSRIQFTPDLMPADIVGSMIMETDDHGHKMLRFQPGPIFANLVLADEINRATPKTQSALLEAMQERTVTSGTVTHELESPFLVMATQNPIEMEGTYPLPEAQLDRFLMKILVTYPSHAELARIVERTIARDESTVHAVLDREQVLELRAVAREILIAPHVQDYAVRLVMATQPDQKEAHEAAKRYVRYGSSPRGAQALVECGRVLALLRGRYHLSVEDVKEIAHSVLRHRIILNFDAHADGKSPDAILSSIISGVSVQASAA